VVERDRLHFAKQMGAIMDAAEPTETKYDGLSININAPCTNRIAGRDYIEVNIHLGGDRQAREESDEASHKEQQPSEIRDLGCDAVEILVPKAVRIARQMRSTA
jgi:hypothetical protein